MELPDFLIIPGVLVKDKTLSPLDRQVYGVIYWCTKLRLEKCIMSNAAIGELLDVRANSVAHAVSALNKAGYIKVMLNTKRQRVEIIPLIAFEGMFKQTRGYVQMNKGVCSNEQQSNNNKEEDLNISLDVSKKIVRTKKTLDYSLPIYQLTYLEEIPEQDLREFTKKYGLYPDKVKREAFLALDWAKTNPDRAPKNKRQYLMRWLGRVADHLGKKQQAQFAQEQVIDELPTWEQLKKEGKAW